MVLDQEKVNAQEMEDFNIIKSLIEKLFPSPTIKQTVAFSRCDLEFNVGTIEYNVEIKNRFNYTSTTYDEWIIEAPKYDYLMQEYKSKLKRPIYACIYKDNKVRIWNIAKSDIRKEERTLPTNTFGDKKKNTRTIYYLNNKDSKLYEI